MNYEQDQSVSPRIWVSFSDIGVVDTDGDGLPNNVEGEIGTDPNDPFNLLPSGTVGDRYGPVDFLPITPPDTQLDVDSSTLPPGLRLENGRLVGTLRHRVHRDDARWRGVHLDSPGRDRSPRWREQRRLGLVA